MAYCALRRVLFRKKTVLNALICIQSSIALLTLKCFVVQNIIHVSVLESVALLTIVDACVRNDVKISVTEVAKFVATPVDTTHPRQLHRLRCRVPASQAEHLIASSLYYVVQHEFCQLWS